MLAIITVILAFVDIIVVIVLMTIYVIRNNIDPGALSDIDIITPAMNRAHASCAGDMFIMILLAPIMLLFSYTRKHKNVFNICSSSNMSAVKHAESAFYSKPQSCSTGLGSTTAVRQLLRTHYL